MKDFETYRPLLFSIAYRMTGSASDAEDLVQEAYLRSRNASTEEIRAPKAYLTTIITHLCLDYLKSARVQREQYIGSWLPEPIFSGDDRLAPLATIEQRESISLAFLVLLESLTPPERAVLILHDVFDYDYAEIANIIAKSEANCRQLLHRAHEHVATHRPRYHADPQEQQQIVSRFLRACQQGDVAALTQLLASSVTNWADGGGKATAALLPVSGQDKVMRLYLGLMKKAPPDLQAQLADINGALAALIWWDGALRDVINFDIANGQITAIRAILNPDKLAHLAAQISPPNP